MRCTEPGRPQRLTTLATLATVVLWSSSFVGIRTVRDDFSAGPLTLARLCVGSLALGIPVLIRRQKLPARRDLRAVAGCGLLWFALYNIALNAGEHRVDAGTAAVIVGVGPLLISLLAGWAFGEQLSSALLVASVISFGGIVIIGIGHPRVSGVMTTGTLLCLVAAAAYAFSVIIQKPLLARIPATELTWLACTVGCLACLPFTPTLLRELDQAPPRAIAGVIYLGIAPTAIAFTTWAYALARNTAGRLAMATYLVPVGAILLGWAFLREPPTVPELVGGAMCIGGVALARFST